MIIVRAEAQNIEAEEGMLDTSLNLDMLRQAEISAIRAFVKSQGQHLRGRVLDYGAGKPGTCRAPQPYRDLCGPDYHPWEPGDPLPAAKTFNAVLCTQVMQYVEDPSYILERLRIMLVPYSPLVMTYPTSWPEIEAKDLWRFPRAGMEILLRRAGFEIKHHEPLAALVCPPNTFVTSYGVVAIAR